MWKLRPELTGGYMTSECLGSTPAQAHQNLKPKFLAIHIYKYEISNVPQINDPTEQGET